MSAPRGLLLALALAASVAHAAPLPAPPPARVDPAVTPEGPSVADRVRPAVVGIRSRIAATRPSAETLGTERWGTAVLLEPGGLAVTVGYLVLEARAIDAVLDSGRIVPARVVGHDFESGLALIRLDPAHAPYPVVRLGRSADVQVGAPVLVVGVREGGRAVSAAARVTAIRPFVAYWEYMLERAFEVAPPHPAFGGAALVDAGGTLVGLVSLRLAEGHLAIPIDLLASVREAVVRDGRPARPSRPWLGVRALALAGGVAIAGVSPGGPAARAGLRPGDVVLRVNGERVADVGDFYRKVWACVIGRDLALGVYRDGQLETVTVRPQDRYAVVPLRSP